MPQYPKIMWRKAHRFYRYDGTDGSNARGNICTDFYDRHVSDDESDDRSFRLSISLMKVFGYRRREIRRLYLDGNFYVILLGAVICVPLAKWSMDLVYPYCIANVAIGMDLKFTPQIYIMIYGGILLCYMVINFLLVGRLNKLVPAEVLKNRE